MSTRTLSNIIQSIPTADGAGVKLRRSLGSQRGIHVDPFLMLDEFYSDKAEDYIGGFPSHPHRGFETVTYMLDGHMRHEDHMGNRGDLKPGDVQWMTAAHGIIHSEMPLQTEGRMRGFQLWINLPSREKMKPASYRDISADEIPAIDLPGGGRAKVIAGTLRLGAVSVDGPINGVGGKLTTDPLYLDVRLPPNAAVTLPLHVGYNAFIYVYEGEARVGPADDAHVVPHRAAGVLSDGEQVRIQAGEPGAQLLLLAAQPLREPVAQYGPFVMNTPEEIDQAIDDYRRGKLTAA
ncbi:MAG: pirin family protein [Steroidobacterales bacterium]